MISVLIYCAYSIVNHKNNEVSPIEMNMFGIVAGSAAPHHQVVVILPPAGVIELFY